MFKTKHFNNNSLIAVADGVGGWSRKNVDPAIYARGIIKAIQELWEKDYK